MAPVIDDNGAGREGKLVSDRHIMDRAVGEKAKAGHIAVMVKHQVQFNRALGPTKLGPVVQREAEVDHRRIETDQFVLEAKFALAGHRGRDRLIEAIKDLLKKYEKKDK